MDTGFAASTTQLVVDAASAFKTQILIILAVVIGIGVGFLIFKLAWRKVKGSHK